MTTTKQQTTKRELILNASAKLFAQQGFDGTSLGAIATAAGVKKSLVQYHFSNKEKLWQSTIEYIWQQRTEALPKYLEDSQAEDDSGDEMLRHLCRSILQFTFDQPLWVKLMFQEASTPGPRLDWMVEHFFTDDFNNGKAMLEMAQQRGLLPNVNTMDLLLILSGALIYLVNVAPITERVLGVDPASSKYIEQHIDTLMQLLNPSSR
jgi:AcrR family transcriptional regulator